MFANPLGLLGLASLAAILGLHLFRRRRRPLVVSAVFLWEDVTSDARGGRTRQPLRRSLSLFAELLGALCLTLALAGPRWFQAESTEHYVAVIDSSASLTARSALDGTSARDRVREAIATSLRELGSNARATLILTGPEPILLAGPFAFRGEALDALEDPWPVLGDHDPTGALLSGAEFAGGGAIDYLTDRAPDDAAPDRERIRHIAVGEAARNVGITASLRTRTPDGDDEIRIVVRNASSRPSTVGLSLGSEGPGPEQAERAAEAPRALTLDPGEARGLTYRVSASAPALVARLTNEDGGAVDGFAADDAAFLCPPPEKTLRLASTLQVVPARALGLDEAGSAERWAEIVVDAIAVPADASPHLVIGLHPGPAKSATDGATWTLALQGPASEPSHLVGPFLLDPSHGLLRGVSLDGVVWSMDESSPISADASVLAYAGDTPLITEELSPRTGRVWTLRLDPERSNLGRSADWPILLANAAEERRLALPGPERTSLALGERFLWRGAPPEPVELVSPAGAVRSIEPSASGDLVTPRLDEPGFWQLRRVAHGEDGARILQTMGVSLSSAAESDLLERSSFAAASRTEYSLGEADAEGGRVHWLETVLILVAAVMLGLNWWVLREGRNTTT